MSADVEPEVEKRLETGRIAEKDKDWRARVGPKAEVAVVVKARSRALLTILDAIMAVD